MISRKKKALKYIVFKTVYEKRLERGDDEVYCKNESGNWD